jgi:hypothetical protein
LVCHQGVQASQVAPIDDRLCLGEFQGVGVPIGITNGGSPGAVVLWSGGGGNPLHPPMPLPPPNS